MTDATTDRTARQTLTPEDRAAARGRWLRVGAVAPDRVPPGALDRPDPDEDPAGYLESLEADAAAERTAEILRLAAIPEDPPATIAEILRIAGDHRIH